jgi:hypothetical protein
VDWDLAYPYAMLEALASSITDHAPLHLSLSASFRPKARFKFEVCWCNLPGFQEAVREAWRCDVAIMDPFAQLDALFHIADASLQAWGQRSVGNIKIQIAIANILIFCFDVA